MPTISSNLTLTPFAELLFSEDSTLFALLEHYDMETQEDELNDALEKYIINGHLDAKRPVDIDITASTDDCEEVRLTKAKHV